MRLRNLKELYIYSSDKKLINGEYQTKWIYKGNDYLNSQQDIDELDRNSAGEVDYEILKLRTDRVLNIDKGDGISFTKLEIDSNNMVINNKPSYIVENKPKIGKTTLYTLVTNNGE